MLSWHIKNLLKKFQLCTNVENLVNQKLSSNHDVTTSEKHIRRINILIPILHHNDQYINKATTFSCMIIIIT